MALLLSALTGVGFCQPYLDQELERFKTALESAPNDAVLLYRIGKLHYERTNYAEAENAFRRALDTQNGPKWLAPSARVFLGRVYDHTDPERAEGEYQRAKELTPPPSTAWELRVASPELVHQHLVGPLTESLPPNRVEYSEEALLARIEGAVVLTGTVAEDGSPRDFRVSKSLGLGLDERALAAVSTGRFTPAKVNGNPISMLKDVFVPFELTDELTRWHLVRAEFQTPEGASRPRFLRVDYPANAGISLHAIEQGRIIAAAGRAAFVTLTFDIDELGMPSNFAVENSSGKAWEPEAIALIRNWQFIPGMKEAQPVRAGCTLTVAWGARRISADVLSEVHHASDPFQPPGALAPPSTSSDLAFRLPQR